MKAAAAISVLVCTATAGKATNNNNVSDMVKANNQNMSLFQEELEAPKRNGR